METPIQNAPPVDLDRLVLLYRLAEEKAAEWQKLLRHAESEAGRVMRGERERHGLSIRRMARRLGCSAPFLSDMERGNRRYSSEWCKKARAALAPQGMNHYCPGESGSGEWSCRSEEVPSLCHYCKTPNAALLSANTKDMPPEGLG